MAIYAIIKLLRWKRVGRFLLPSQLDKLWVKRPFRVDITSRFRLSNGSTRRGRFVMPRIPQYKSKWKKLIDMYGASCFYCREEMATSIDHIIPHSWTANGELDNLVPACGLCNSIAGNKMFEYVEEKRQYILARRKRYTRRAICTECLLPFSYRDHSPSMFLCAECYDREYGTLFSERQSWKTWKRELVAAGIFPDTHKAVREKLGAHCKKWTNTFMAALADGYENQMEAM